MSTVVAAIPWYKSSVMIGAVVTIVSTLALLVPKLAAALGLTSPDLISASVNSVFEVIALLAGAWTAYARKASPLQPVTLTQTAANTLPVKVLATVGAAGPVAGTATVAGTVFVPIKPWEVNLTDDSKDKSP